MEAPGKTGALALSDLAESKDGHVESSASLYICACELENDR